MPTPRVHGVHSANVEEVGHTFLLHHRASSVLKVGIDKIQREPQVIIPFISYIHHV